MEGNSDVVRVKEEPSSTWTEATVDTVFILLDYCKVENFETVPFHELPAKGPDQGVSIQGRLDEKIFIDLECKNLKPELPLLSTTIFKSEYQHFLPIVKIEYKKKTHDINEKCLIILIKKDFDYDNNCQFNMNSCLKLADYENLKSFEKTVEKNHCLNTHQKQV